MTWKRSLNEVMFFPLVDTPGIFTGCNEQCSCFSPFLSGITICEIEYSPVEADLTQNYEELKAATENFFN